MKKPSKYRSVKTEYNGVIYDSKKEAAYAKTIDFYLETGLIKNLLTQVKFEWWESHFLGTLKSIDFKRKYICDFVYFDVTSGQTMYVDVKGFRTAEFKKKKKIVEHLFNIKITEK